MSDLLKRLENLPPEKRELVLKKIRQQKLIAKPENQFQNSPIKPIPRNQEIPLSFAQERLWIVAQLEGGSAAYNMPGAVQMKGSINLEALKQSLQEIVRRHEVLRTSFQIVKGSPVQDIDPNPRVTLPVVDLEELSEREQLAEVQRLGREEAQKAFDLKKSPLVRFKLLRLGQQDHVLLITMHHIVSDGWSIGVLSQELKLLYADLSQGKPPSLPSLPIQYADFAVWERGWLQGEVLEKRLNFWKDKLKGVPTILELPTDYPRPQLMTNKGATLDWQLPPTLSEALKALSKQEGVSLFMVLMAAFQILVFRYSKQEDFVIATSDANRNLKEVEGLIGFFVNQVLFRSQLYEEPTFQELLQRLRQETLSAYEYKDLPFSLLVEEMQPERDPSRNPLFQILFILQNTPRLKDKWTSNLEISVLNLATQTSRLDSMISITEEQQGMLVSWEYSTDLFEEETILLLLEAYQNILEQCVRTTQQKISAFALPEKLIEKRTINLEKRNGVKTQNVHHLGIACQNITEELQYIKQIYQVTKISDIIYDPFQNADVCLIETENGINLELVSGSPVENLLSQGTTLYHVCYEIPDLISAIEEYTRQGATLVAQPKPAKLFDNRLVAFVNTSLGLVELLEKTKSALSEELLQQLSSSQMGHRQEKIAIAATFTAEPLKESMAFWLSELDLPWQIEFAPYHQVFQQLLDPASHLAQNKKGINVVLVRFEDWLKSQDSLARIGDRPEEVEQEIERNRKDLLLALKSAAKRSSTPYLVCFCPPSPSFLEYGQGVTVLQQREDQLAEELKAIAGIYVTSHSELLGLYPVADYDNPGGNMLGHIPYTPLFFSALATIIARQVAAITTPPYKVIALDCDQTLWQGVCGEVGPEGIVIDTPWQKLQEFMVAQQEAGMLLCLCSKNNEEDVLTVFEQHPEMPLNLDHFVSRRINWKSKSENLKALAAELKLGLDSFIFIDDNPIECSEVQANCPAVLTLQLPQESSQIPHFLQHIWAFDRLKVTKEDRGRRELYRQNVQREHLRQESLTFEDFLAKLELQVDIKVITSADIPRVSQLTKRTNQFNATTIRRSEGEIQQLLESGQLDCLTVKVKDRFGDYGLVGVMLFGIQSDTLMVDSFLLSCRALGRGVEYQMLAKLGAIANELGLSWVELPYVQTQKNQPVRDFLQAVGSKYQQEQNGALRFRFPSKQIEGLSFKPETVETDKVSSSLSSQVSQEVSKGRVLSPLYQRIATELSTAEQVYQAVSSQKHWQKRALTEAYVAPRNSVEEKIAEIWGDVLKIEQVGINDNFFTVGGTSLLGIQVINRLGEVFQVELPLIKLFEKPTVAGIAECIDNIQSQNQKSTSVHSNLDEWVEGDRLRCNAPKGLLTDELSPKLAPRKTEIIHFLEESKQMSDSSLTNFLPPSPLVKIQPEGSKIPLFCVHPAGGYVLCYFDLGQYLGSDRPFYGLQSVGLDGQSEPLSRIEDMAACYIDAIKEIQPQGPYQLAGWSFGGLVAFEMAQQLHLQGQQVAFLGLIDTCTPSLQPPAPEDNVAVLLELFGDQLDLSSEILEQLEPDAQLLHVLEKAKQADMIPPDWGLEQARHLLKIFHCNVKASYSYLPQVYSGKITLFPANQEKSFSTNDPTLGWSEFTNQDLEIYSISGTHHDIVKTPQVKLLAELISQCVHAN